MKILMTIAATVAFTAAVNAQQSACTIINNSGTSLARFNTSVETVSIEGGVNIVDRNTGAILDFIPETPGFFLVRCSVTDSANEGSGNSSVTRNSSSGTTRNTVTETSTSDSDGNTDTTRTEETTSSRTDGTSGTTSVSSRSSRFSSLLASLGL